MIPSPRKYRWVIEGERYRYQPTKGKALDMYQGAPCLVLTLSNPGAKPAKALVQFDDGLQVITSAVVLRKLSP